MNIRAKGVAECVFGSLQTGINRDPIAPVLEIYPTTADRLGVVAWCAESANKVHPHQLQANG